MAGHTDNDVVINAPIQKVWEITNDIENWPNLFTEYAEAKILTQEGNRIVFRLTMQPDGQGNQWSWTSERIPDPQTYTVKSKRLETGWFEYMNLAWFYEPVEGGTRMRWVQDFVMKPDSPVDEQQMQTNLNKNTRVQMDVIKERIERQVGAAV
jgi:aromatase